MKRSMHAILVTDESDNKKFMYFTNMDMLKDYVFSPDENVETIKLYYIKDDDNDKSNVFDI